MRRYFWTVATLWHREIVRFYRQPSRVVGALGSPVIFWLLIGSGIGHSLKAGEGIGSDHYLLYFFPGTILLILLFTAVFSTISLIEDRREGFLQSVLIAPAARSAMVLGKIFGGTTLAVMQGILFLLLAPLIGIHLGFSGWVQIIGVLFISAFTLTGLGFLMAWQFNSIQGFHAVMNLLLIPLWLLSGALFPREGAADWLQAVMTWNPLTYEMILLQASLAGKSILGGSADLTVAAVWAIGFGLVTFVMASVSASRRRAEDLT